MPKIKTCRAAAKRFKKTGTGKLVRNKAYKSHILTKKSQKSSAHTGRAATRMSLSCASVLTKTRMSSGATHFMV